MTEPSSAAADLAQYMRMKAQSDPFSIYASLKDSSIDGIAARATSENKGATAEDTDRWTEKFVTTFPNHVKPGKKYRGDIRQKSSQEKHDIANGVEPDDVLNRHRQFRFPTKTKNNDDENK